MGGKLERLTRLVGSDPGFYVLAVHSFVEHYLRDVLAVSDAERFSDLLWEYRAELLEGAGGGYVDGLHCLKNLGRQHKFTNAVRHSFSDLDPEEAVAATHLFVVFCALARLGEQPAVRRLERSLHLWEQRQSIVDRSAALSQMQVELQSIQSRNASLVAQLSEFEESGRKLALLEHQIERFTLELDEAHSRLKAKDSRVDELRRERAGLRDERRELKARMNGYAELERYIRNLGRVSVYTRTRMDYERTLLRLTPEQSDAVAAIDRNGDFLIRGSAGTGKSLVLIEALRRALEVGELDFGEGAGRRALLLTFTRTLAKFEDYVTSILRIEGVSALVQTVDAFFLARLKLIDADYGFDFDAVNRLAAEHNDTGFFADEELATEIETYLFGNLVTRQEYVDDVVDRVGLRRRLSQGQREVVWSIRETIASAMRDSGRFSRNFARVVVLDYLSSASEEDAGRLRDVRTIYLDEVQDLTAGDLRTLKLLVTGHLIMAADSDQTIYGVSSPYARAGISISGRTRVLKTNFRNTRQIHELARRFRDDDDSSDAIYAFREGPPPELYTATDEKALLQLLLAKLDLFTGQLEYDPENIAILAPHNAEVDFVAASLGEAGIQAEVITARDFRFASSGALRLSTLHSSKGLDFPVVMMYLPYLRRRETFDEEATNRLLRNLIYVGITRAMENLNIFVLPNDDPIIDDVIAAASG